MTCKLCPEPPYGESSLCIHHEFLDLQDGLKWYQEAPGEVMMRDAIIVELLGQMEAIGRMGR